MKMQGGKGPNRPGGGRRNDGPRAGGGGNRSGYGKPSGGGYRGNSEGGSRGPNGGGYRGNSEGGYKGQDGGGYRGNSEGGYKGQGGGGYRGNSEGGYKGQGGGGYRGNSEGGYKGQGGGYRGNSEGGYKGQGQSGGGYRGNSEGGYKGQGQGGGGYRGNSEGGYKGQGGGGYRGNSEGGYKGQGQSGGGYRGNSEGDSRVPSGGYRGGFNNRPSAPRERGENRPAPTRNDYTPRPPRERDVYAPPAGVDAPPVVAPDTGARVAPENLLIGRNPIREALRAGRHFEALYVQKGELNGSAREIVKTAKEKRVQIREVDRRALENMAPGHQGLIAVVSAHQYAELDDLFARAAERGEDPLFIVLDGITDPHNMGAIARTAECCGAHGIILCERRAVGMTPGAAKAAAGAFEYLPIVRVPNIARLIEQLQQKNVWVYAADVDAPAAYDETELKGPIALVIGDEGEGVSRLALDRCDGKVKIPICGKIDSLNASVAAGILMYDVIRQRKP